VNIAEVLSGRAGLAGVQWALLARPLRKLLRAELGALLAAGSTPASCRLRRAKFKPGRKLTAYYATAIRSQDARACRMRPIAVTWTPQGNGAEEPSPALLELQEEALARGLAAPFRQLAAEAPSWGMRLHVSPLDERFPQLVRLSDPCYVREQLAMMGTASSANPSDPSARPAAPYTITPIRYRPGQRHVLRYEPANGGNGANLAGANLAGVVFAKLYHGGNGARFCRVADRVSAWLETKAEAGVTAVRPCGYLPADDVVLYPRMAGRTLSSYLRRPGSDVARHLRRAGIMLRALHEAPPDVTAELKPHDFTLGVKLIARASEHIEVLLPSTAPAIAALLDRAQALYAHLPQETPTLAHGDFKADHLWVARASLTLIDLDDCCLADPALDIGKFLADLQWWYALSNRPGLEQAQAHFLEGYGLDSMPARLVRARLYEALWLVKITVRRVRLFDPDWAHRTVQMIGRAEAAFERLQTQSTAYDGV
jgi:aminoglycoside phosphotransferase (APT) family kinase protein